ncbi:hypothetical protein Q9L58_004684 [Maublancomyces gigas]|uniref:B30.2/SPRY domain-containing protein n=1 Tax=Discina gigas TaxID=1032678 RepID=A0ABR3GK77_9PEZI
MEVVGAVSSILAIITATLQVARGLSNLISEIKDAPQSLQRLGQECRDLEVIFVQIDQTNFRNVETSLNSAAVEMSVRSCRDELGRLRDLLESLAPKSTGSGIHRRTLQGIKKFFKEDDIGDAINALQSRKLSICLALMTNLASTKGGYASGRKNGGVDINPPEYRLLHRATTFDLDRKPLLGGPVDGGTSTNEVTPTKLLEKIISQTIERTMEKVQGEFLRKPNAKIEDFFSLGSIETKQLWAINLQSVREFRAAELERRCEEFLQSLPCPDYHGDRIKARNAQVGTCEWIFDHPQYLAWQKDEGPSIIYAMGKPGSGKTVLSRHVLEALREANPDTTELLYCFCNNRDNPNQTAPDILGAMIHQFLSHKKSLLPIIMNKRQVSRSMLWSLESLWEIFLILVDTAQLDVVYCFVDALDECEAESVSDLLALVSDVANSSKSLVGRVVKVKFFLTSRPFERLEVELDHHIVRTIRLTPEIVNQDIERIVNDGMDKLQKKLRLKKEVKDRLWGILVSRSEGMFLWVLLAMKQLERARFVTAQKLEKLIQALPNGLNGIYDRMLEGLETNISDPDDLSLIRKMITWVVLAQRPLTVSEFKVAIAIQLDSDSMDSVEVMLYISREIRNLCGSFLEVVSEQEPGIIVSDRDPSEDNDIEDPVATVRLIHQSAKDYFFDREKRLSFPLSKFRIHERFGHNEIASICLTYLLFKDFGTGSFRLDSSASNTTSPAGEGDDDTTIRKLLEQRIADYPFLKYAVLAWGYHVRSSTEGLGSEATVDPALMIIACRFLEKPMCREYWFQLYEFLRDSGIFDAHKVNALHVACLMDLPTIATYILNNWSIDIDECSSEGKTALLFAVNAILDSTDSQILTTILGSNPDVNVKDKKGKSVLIIAAEHGSQLSTVRLLLDRGADIETRQEDSSTALHLASANGHKETVELLLDRGANIESKTEYAWTPLLMASADGQKETAELLLDRGANIEAKQAQCRTALQLACTDGHREMAEFLLDRGADIESKDGESWTSLHLAAVYGHKDTVQLLLDRGASVNSRTNYLLTPLLTAASSGHKETVELLLDRGSDIGSGQSQSWTALHLASSNGYKETAELILDRGVDIEVGGEDSSTALHLASASGHKEMVKFLLDRGANIECKSKHSWTPLFMASKNEHKETVEILLDRGANIEAKQAQGHTVLQLACADGHREMAEFLLDRGADIESKDGESWTSLHLAANHGHKDTVQLLLDKGANTNSRTDYLWTPLLVAVTNGHKEACANGHGETADLLLNKGADIECKTDDSWTALHLALFYEKKETVGLLLDRGADIEARQNDYFTALHLVSSYGLRDMTEFLLDRGVDIEARTNSSCTALHLAPTETIAKLLLDRGANTESKQADSQTALHLAASSGSNEMVKLLLDRGADIESKQADSMTALHLAASFQHNAVVELLLDRGANIDSRQTGSQTPLHLVARYGYYKSVKLLLDRGADIESKQYDSMTALHLAVSCTRGEVAELLLDRGADTGCVSFIGETPLYTAVSIGDEEMTKLLLSRGAAVGVYDTDWTSIHIAVLWGRLSLLRSLMDQGVTWARDHILADAGVLLQSAVLSGNIEIVELLLNMGTDTNATSSRACTALHTAASEGAIGIFNMLLEHKADPHRVDCNGWSPIICAWRSRRQAVIERLLELGLTLPDKNHMVTRAPTCWSNVEKSALLSLSKDNLFIQTPDIVPKILSVKADHCMSAERDLSYFEAEIVKMNGIITIGVSRASSKLTTHPGWLKGTLGHHGDDGGIFSGSGQPSHSLESYTTGDTIGFGVNFDQSTAFHTKNGKFLGSSVHESVSGQLYPTISFSGPNAQVNTNFGQKPFLFQDFGKIVISKD